ncbi:MAG: M15 family metallopeptidase [Eubacterium sp.]|nr:M15 family metallopeptidase [Eubacterium sp.]
MANGKKNQKQTADSQAAADSQPGSQAAQADGSGSQPSYTEYDQTKPQQASGTDERTLYAANPDTEIYYSYEDNQVQFSANAGQSIQAVPERLPEEQRIDTTTDDTDTTHYQQLSSEWNLILVNPWNEIPDDYEISLASLPNGHSIDSRCYPALTEMLDACRKAGLRPLICSSYRSKEKQQSLFLERINELAAQGYTKKEARQKAATSVARPGTSEHQAGLAVDIVDSSHQLLDATQEHTPVQQWLMENSWKYGFILRYPLDKSRLTGIIYEPWHYRYVGKEAAKEIYERGICLEEYLEEKS